MNPKNENFRANRDGERVKESIALKHLLGYFAVVVIFVFIFLSNCPKMISCGTDECHGFDLETKNVSGLNFL